MWTYLSFLQLFLEEERERELEALYESQIADSLNRNDAPLGSGAGEGATPGGITAQAETTGVSKQTTETLMAGERIMEALELADNERKAFAEYEEAMAKLDENDAMRLQAPPRNPILAAYNLEPEAYVLRVVDKVPSTALHDALLVLPFQKVVSLMVYLDIWTQKVSTPFVDVFSEGLHFLSAMEHYTRITHNIFLTSNSSSSNRGEPDYEDIPGHPAQTSPQCIAKPEGSHGLQSSCFAILAKKRRIKSYCSISRRSHR